MEDYFTTGQKKGPDPVTWTGSGPKTSPLPVKKAAGERGVVVP